MADPRGAASSLPGGAFLALFGLYLLWIDFVSPNRERI
jgi:hypothetical protein